MNETPYNVLVVPLVRGAQLFPPSVVLRIVPLITHGRSVVRIGERDIKKELRPWVCLRNPIFAAIRRPEDFALTKRLRLRQFPYWSR